MSSAIKKCRVCDFEGFVFARKMHCPLCKTKNTLINQPSALLKTKESLCECGCGETVIAPIRFKTGHNMQRNPLLNYRDGRAYKHAICSQCTKVFERRSDQIGTRTFCSPKCANEANGQRAKGRTLPSKRTGKSIACLQCGHSFYASGSRVKKNAKFCSRKCYQKWDMQNPIRKGFISSIDNRGEKNGRYKHGRRVGAHIPKKKVREQVIAADGNWCWKCGKPGPGLHLHRVVYGSQGGAYEVDNCMLLCAEHHELVHSNKTYWMPILQDHLKRRKHNLA